MRGLIAVAVWLALSVPVALLVARIIRSPGGGDDVAGEAERWLWSRSADRPARLRAAMARTVLAVVLLAPLTVAAGVAAWRLPDAVTVTRADGQLALAWPPGQDDHATSTTSTSAVTVEEPAAAPQPEAVTPADAGGATVGAAAIHDGPDGEPPFEDGSPSAEQAEPPHDEASPGEPPTTTRPADRPCPDEQDDGDDDDPPPVVRHRCHEPADDPDADGATGSASSTTSTSTTSTTEAPPPDDRP